MFDIDRDKHMKIHFIGIGGISMSGLAEILIDYGYSVSGSDRAPSKLTDKLKSLGAKIFIGHNGNNIKGSDLVVYTAAVKEDNEEYIEAKRLGIPLIDRAEFLGYIMKKFNKGIAISGTHGKTTTTSMMSLVLLEANLDPTILVGGELDAINGNVRPGKSPYFITEACEYKRSFLKFYPYIGVILNIDADHLDYYKDIEEICETFLEFALKIPKDGLLIGCSDDPRVKKVLDSVDCNVISYGIDSGDYRASNIEFSELGFPKFTVTYRGDFIGEFTLNVPGKHNVLNALSTIAASTFLGIDTPHIQQGLHDFRGTHRRFEKKGEYNGATIIDDYAHHPNEIMATISAAKNYPHKKFYLAFQPHTYTRTRTLFKEFTTAFNGVDELILLDIYAAREKDTGEVNTSMLNDAIVENGVNSSYMKSFDEVVEHMKKVLEPGDLFITMGAGDVYKIGEKLTNK